MDGWNLLLTIITALALGLACGLIAAVYRFVLAYEPILSWWFQWGNNFEGRFFFPPIWGCEKCIAGQLAMWFYLSARIIPAILTHLRANSAIGLPATVTTQMVATGILGILTAITAAMLSAMVLGKFIQSRFN